MDLKKYQPLKEVFFLSILVYSIHKLIFFTNQNSPSLQNFHFPIEVVDAFFFICSFFIIFILIKVHQINVDYVGYTFLLLTCIKIGLSLLILFPILNSGGANMKTEKIDFFVIFTVFLSIETLVVVKILNIKQ